MKQQVILPGGTIGILGGGQLARMLCMAATAMGYKTVVYSDSEDVCAAGVCTHFICAKYGDETALRKLVRMCDVITYEWENIPIITIDLLLKYGGKEVPVYPGRKVLAVSQDRILEKQTARDLRIATPGYGVILEENDLKQVQVFPVILKTARNGYDGKGQKKVADAQELEAAWESFGKVPCVAEEVLDFLQEFSIILARTLDGTTVNYPIFLNEHRDGILHSTEWPKSNFIGAALSGAAIKEAKSLADHLGVVGVFTVEMFCTRRGREILFNEMAPRVHNSGHITIDCAVTTQFEQHIRAICGLPLGSPDIKCGGHMRNIIGEQPDFADLYVGSNRAKIHWYGKGEVREGRKMGHITYIHECR